MWKKKLRAFCEGLEVENIDILLERGDVGDYRLLGQVMAMRTKDVASRRPLTPVSVVRQNTAEQLKAKISAIYEKADAIPLSSRGAQFYTILDELREIISTQR